MGNAKSTCPEDKKILDKREQLAFHLASKVYSTRCADNYLKRNKNYKNFLNIISQISKDYDSGMKIGEAQKKYKKDVSKMLNKLVSQENCVVDDFIASIKTDNNNKVNMEIYDKAYNIDADYNMLNNSDGSPTYKYQYNTPKKCAKGKEEFSMPNKDNFLYYLVALVIIAVVIYYYKKNNYSF